jgi:hypothetical protein
VAGDDVARSVILGLVAFAIHQSRISTGRDSKREEKGLVAAWKFELDNFLYIKGVDLTRYMDETEFETKITT